MTKWDSFQVHKGWFDICKLMWHTSETEDKNHMIISIDAEKAFDIIQHQFMIKALTKVGIYWTYLKIIKTTYEKPTTNTI